MTRRLEGRTAVVTGAASGFGEATARRLHAEGANVLVADINAEGAKTVAESIGAGAIATGVDITVGAQVADAIALAVEEFGGLDIMVNNAGVIHAKMSVETIPDEEFDRIVDINLRGTFLGIKHATPALRKRGGGVILNTASIGAIMPRMFTAAYSATKAGIITLTRSAAIDLAPQIRVNAVCPAASPTQFLKGSAGGGGAVYEAYVASMQSNAHQSIPLGRLAEPNDVAAAFAFLASDDAAFITGIALPVDGGRSAGDTAGRVGVAETTEA
jgi:3-oxoacyl-[acyl-carrier protein] reductase